MITILAEKPSVAREIARDCRRNEKRRRVFHRERLPRDMGAGTSGAACNARRVRCQGFSGATACPSYPKSSS